MLPLRTLPSEATARKKKVVIGRSAASSEFLRDAHHFVPRSDAVRDLLPAVLAQIAHAVAAGSRGQHRCIRVLHHQAPDLVGDLHHLEDTHARYVAAAIALRAAFA